MGEQASIPSAHSVAGTVAGAGGDQGPAPESCILFRFGLRPYKRFEVPPSTRVSPSTTPELDAKLKAIHHSRGSACHASEALKVEWCKANTPPGQAPNFEDLAALARARGILDPKRWYRDFELSLMNTWRRYHRRLRIKNYGRDHPKTGWK